MVGMHSSNPVNRRRSQRVMLRVPITVSGESTNGPFREETYTMVVNAHGALISLAANVLQQQTLRIKTGTHREEQTCRVIHAGPLADGVRQIGIEFEQPAPHFWHIAFPPEDWTPVIDTAPAEAKTKA